MIAEFKAMDCFKQRRSLLTVFACVIAQLSLLSYKASTVDISVAPTLRRKDYYTSPTMDMLGRMSADELSAIPNFRVGRVGYGEVFWPGKTDILGVDLDEVVFIEHGEIMVYSDHSTTPKPFIGTKLNRPAVLTLQQIFSSRDVATADFASSVQNALQNIGASDIMYDETVGSCSFKVPHFSKYGLSTVDTQALQRRAAKASVSHSPRQLQSLGVYDSAVSPDAYVCACPPGYTGFNCETDIDECASTPCLHGGTCKQGVNSYKCTCASGYTDVPIGTCLTELDECSSAPCLNSGTCFDHTFAYTCICADGFSGYNCEINPDECGSSPCMNGSTCTDMIDAYECTCGDGWSGGHCELEVDACKTDVNDCDSLRSACIMVGAGKHECVCHPGYETSNGGKTCTTVQECSSSPCMNGSTCVDGACTYAACIMQWSCVCASGWAGALCDVDLDECSSYPCANAATCVDGVFSYACVCGAGYTGFNCEADIVECLSLPCMNGATCLDSSTTQNIIPNTYTCTCAAGFAGDICGVDIDECASSPCLHSATCTQGVDAYKCTCAAGYADVPVGTCMSDLDECSSVPCLNSGTCFDHAFAYSCVCADGYSGYNCEVNPDECGSSPCMNGSTCTG